MADDLGQEVRDLWRAAEEADRVNREEALHDLKFAAGEHWDDQVRQYRETMGTQRYGFPLPCLTINTLPQFIGQVIGDRRANATAIKVLPREDGDVNIAEVRSELIRSIELQSKADRVYATTFEQAVTCGIGNFRVDMDYAYEDAFDRDLFIRNIANPLAVLWDPLASDPTGRDANYCFVTDKLTKDEYEKRFKESADALELDARGLQDDGWVDSETVRIAEYWRITEKTRTIALLADGSVQDVTDRPENEWQPLLYRGPDGSAEPRVRKAQCKYATMVLTNGRVELSDPFELKLHRLPIIRAMGREIWVGERRVRYGLTRFARDPARLKDYWRSLIAEKLMLSPRANYIASDAAVKGREGDWPNTLVFNSNSPSAPVAIAQQDMAAIMNEAQMCSQDMKDTTGIHEASLGMPSNETSGRAILARQHEGDIATIVYHDNMNSAMQEAGEVLNALIPIVYDTARTIRTVGEDEAVKLIRVNDPNFVPSDTVKDGIPNLALGRYDVTISTGPAYMTKRQEASASMIEATQAAPQLWQIAGDLIAKAQDWPDADIIAERIKRSIPPQLLGKDEQQDQASDPNEQGGQPQDGGQAQVMQQMAAQQAMAQQAAMAQDMRLKSAQADKAENDALKSHAEALKAWAELNAGDGGDLEAQRIRTEQFNALTNRMKVMGDHMLKASPPQPVNDTGAAA